jgi:hypothetical protein
MHTMTTQPTALITADPARSTAVTPDERVSTTPIHRSWWTTAALWSVPILLIAAIALGAAFVHARSTGGIHGCLAHAGTNQSLVKACNQLFSSGNAP